MKILKDIDKEIYNENLDSIVRKVSQSMYWYDHDIYYDDTGEIKDYLMDIKEAHRIHNKYMSNQKLKYKWNRAVALSCQYRQLRQRIAKRIDYMIHQSDCVFITLTFRDDVLDNTKASYRRRCVREFCKSWSKLYVANLDFGSTTEREHYHGVIMCDYIDMKTWKYGFMYVEKVRLGKKSYEKLSTYVTKLTNHAVKDSCRRKDINELVDYNFSPIYSSKKTL